MKRESHYLSSIGGKMLLIFISISLVAVSSVAILSIISSSSELKRAAFNSLTSVQRIKKVQIQNFFNERKGDVRVLANDPYVKEAFLHLNRSMEESGGSSSNLFSGTGNGNYKAPESYRNVHDVYSPFFEYYMEQYGYYDIFLINAENGDTVYTVTKEPDFGISVRDFSSSLHDVWSSAIRDNKVRLSDTKPYEPSGGVPAQFVISPITEKGEVIGMVALQISLEAINSIMQQRDGMGDSGETYLVGSDKLMRSDSYVDKSGNHSVINSLNGTVEKNGVDTEAVNSAFAGESDAKIIIDYNGNPVLSVYDTIDMDGFKWAILAEIDEAEINQPINSLILTIVIVTVLVLVAVIVIIIFFSRSISHPIKAVVALTEELSTGNLNLTVDDQHLKRKDEVGQLSFALHQMIDKLSEVVSIVLSGSEQIASASEQLSTGNQDLSNRTEQQATALEETSSSIEEMNSSIRSNADNTKSADQLSNVALDKTKDGSDAVQSMMESMSDISVSSNRIADIIEVINNIAFQTNLLALNASIEAARAGEQGKGFAVVAVEVRKLAKRSDKAATEIAEIIRNSNKKVQNGVEIANEAGEMLTEISASVKKVSSLVSEISAASQEQLTSVEQIDKTIASLDENTQKNAALVEEAASSTEELSAQAQELNTNMNFFKLQRRNHQEKPKSLITQQPEREMVLVSSGAPLDETDAFTMLSDHDDFAEF